MRRRVRALAFVLIAAFLLGEVVLRLWGMGNYPLFRADPRYEYFTLPHQDVRMGHVIFRTNEFGMRCGPVGAKRGRRVLVIGDSVVNGGYQTTQDSLGTEVAQRLCDEKDGNIQWLNLSAGSWGAGNAAAFLEAHGLFAADELIAVFSSHDAYDRMTFGPVVGRHPSYPDRKPLLAWGMLFKKLMYRSGSPAEIDTIRRFDPGWQRLVKVARRATVPLTVLLHPERGEVATHRYDARGRRLIDSLETWGVHVVPLLPRMPAEAYTDHIHINPRGQRILAEAMTGVVVP